MDNLPSRIADVFDKAPFIRHLGVRVVAAGDEWVETELEVADHFRQQHGFGHAGVVATLADHTAGAAASTAIGEGQSVLTADYNIHLMRPAIGDLLRCRGEIIRAGRTIIVTQADVTVEGEICARYTGTMVVVDRSI